MLHHLNTGQQVMRELFLECCRRDDANEKLAGLARLLRLELFALKGGKGPLGRSDTF